MGEAGTTTGGSASALAGGAAGVLPRRVVYVGPLWAGHTCLQRMRMLERLGIEVLPIDTQPESVRHRQGALLERLRRRLFG